MSIDSSLSSFLRTKLKGTSLAGTPSSGSIDANTQALHVGAFIGTPAQLAAATPVIAQNWPWQAIKAQGDPTALFAESYDTALDTVNKWVSTAGAGGVLPSVSGGLGSLSAGVAVSGYSKLTTIPSFTLPAQSFLSFAAALQIDATVTTNNYRFFGGGYGPAVPTVTAAVTDGAGFEITTTGAMNAVVWSGGVKTFSQAVTRPTDGLLHRYSVMYKTSRIYWFIDSQDVSVATVSTAAAGYSAPQLSTLPILQVSVNDPTLTPTVNGVPATAVKFNFQFTNVADFGRNATQLADGVSPWRTANIGKSGGLSVKGSSVANVSTSIAAAATGTAGPVDVSEAGNVTFIVKNTVTANAYAGNPVLVFEQSDNNIDWGPVSVVRSDTGASSSTFTLVPNTAGASLAFDMAAEGINFVRARVTTGPTTNAMTVVVQAGGMPFSPVVTSVNQPITKGTQSTTGVTTQDLKDAGRNLISFYTVIPVLTTATDTLQSLTVTKGGATVAATTTPAVVTTGKTLRITSLAATYIATATSGYGIVRLRSNSAGVVAITSPVLRMLTVGASNPATANSTGSEEALFPDGLEVPSTGGFGISVQGFAAATATAVGYVIVSGTGFEY